MPYVEYNFYSEIYGGKKIKEEDFASIERRIEVYLDRFTFGRISNVNPEELPYLKECICEMADGLYTSTAYQDVKEKKSESIDGYTVTFVTEALDGEEARQTLYRKLYNIAKFYLEDTGILYVGVY